MSNNAKSADFRQLVCVNKVKLEPNMESKEAVVLQYVLF